MSHPRPYRNVAPEEVQAELTHGSALCLVDVRQDWEHERRHIPGVLLIPLDELPARFSSELNPADTVICLCEHGIRSRQAAAFLAAQGFSNVATMTGGMAEYDGPVVMEPAEPISYESAA